MCSNRNDSNITSSEIIVVFNQKRYAVPAVFSAMDRKISDLTKKLKEGEFLLDEDTTEFALRNNCKKNVLLI